MPVIIHVVDAFTRRPFAGNPAAVCVLEAPADEEWMKRVAREMNLSETAFLHPVEGGWSLRWLTPKVEVALCGHATLASAFVLWETGLLHAEEVRFHTLSGWLICRKARDWIEMDFPATAVQPCSLPEALGAALGAEFISVRQAGSDYLVEVADEEGLRQLRPNFSLLETIPLRGVIATCRSGSADYDFYSRFFAPAVGVNEDPVTGSAHCALGPFWMKQLGKNEFTAFQASERGGVVRLKVLGDRVLLQGQAVMMSRSELLH